MNALRICLIQPVFGGKSVIKTGSTAGDRHGFVGDSEIWRICETLQRILDVVKNIL